MKLLFFIIIILFDYYNEIDIIIIIIKMGSCFSRMKHCSLFSKHHNVALNENQASSSHLFEHENNSSHSSIDFFLEDIDECLNETEKIFLSVIDTM